MYPCITYLIRNGVIVFEWTVFGTWCSLCYFAYMLLVSSTWDENVNNICLGDSMNHDIKKA